MRRFASSILLLAALAVFPAAAHAVPTITGEFSLGPDAEPRFIAPGPDGNMWLTLGGVSDDDVARITPDGTVTQFDLPNADDPTGIVAGPDGNMWMTGAQYVARFSPADPTAAVKTTINGINSPEGIVAGTDGNLWTASGEDVFRIPPANPALGEDEVAKVPGMSARGMAVSSDGLIWVGDQGGTTNGRVLSVTTAATPAVTPHDVGGGVMDVAAGANGQVAFSNPFTDPNYVGLLVNGGTHTPVPYPLCDPTGIELGADGAYWSACFGTKDLARVTPDGQLTKLGGFSPGSGPRHIAAGPNNTLWVTLEGTNKVARISGVDPADTQAPTVSGLSLTASRFAVGPKRTPLTAAAKRVPLGTRLRYTSDEAGTASIRIERALTGRRKGKSCVAPRKSLRRKKKCTRYKRVGTLQRSAIAGRNSVAFSGRIGRKALKQGSYRFVVTVTDARGNASQPKTKSFRIVKKKKRR